MSELKRLIAYAKVNILWLKVTLHNKVINLARPEYIFVALAIGLKQYRFACRVPDKCAVTECFAVWHSERLNVKSTALSVLPDKVFVVGGDYVHPQQLIIFTILGMVA